METIKAKKQNWLSKKLAERSRRAQRAYRPFKGWQLDTSAATAPKHLASRYYQLKTGHAAIGAYFHRIHVGRIKPAKDARHQKKKCRTSFLNGRQRTKLYKALGRAGITRPSATEDCPKGRLLGEPKATEAILPFLATTKVAFSQGHVQQAAKRARRDDGWGIEALEGAVRTGER